VSGSDLSRLDLGDDKVLLDKRGPVAWLTLNRPDKLNALDLESVELIARFTADVNADPAVRALVVTGAGRAFCAGGDLAAIRPLLADPGQFGDFLTRWNDAFDSLEQCRVPTIAAVDGITFAGGLELTHVCDFVVLGDDVTIGDQHANYGIFPAGGSIQRLARIIGARRAKWVVMSGAVITPRQALDWGLANVLCPADDVLPEATRMAELLAAKSASLNWEVKRGLTEDLHLSVREAMAAERPHALGHAMGADQRAGIQAFAERAEPHFLARQPGPDEHPAQFPK
jgi:enoyl-CoA hydratase/carnithine racemase